MLAKRKQKYCLVVIQFSHYANIVYVYLSLPTPTDDDGFMCILLFQTVTKCFTKYSKQQDIKIKMTRQFGVEIAASAFYASNSKDFSRRV